jgi:hypothetical protein
MAVEVTPWWKALKIRQEIINASGQIDDVQMSLFQAVYGAGSDRPPYADAAYYGEITHPTGRLVDLLTEIAVRIGAGDDYLKARSVTRLDQGMGGGKSHACIGAFHLAANPEALFTTELGQQVAKQAKARTGTDFPPDLNRPHVVVLPCDNMTPGAGVQQFDGPAVSLYERFLWRLFSKDYSLYERYLPYWNDKSKIAEAIKAINRPVLVIIDEVLDYVGNGLDGANKPDLAAQDMAFLRALLDVVNDVPNVALLAVMIASDTDKTSLSAAGRDRRDDLNTLLERNGLPATVTEVSDFASILRRRLFDSDPAAEVLAATANQYQAMLSDKTWSKNVWDSISADWRQRWSEEVTACYPFHPMLMAMAKEEWSQVTGFQRVRSTIRIFAATVFAQQQRGKAGEWVPALIGPGDLPLSESAVREALLGSGLVEDDRTIANYRSLAEIEIVNNDGTRGTARSQDLQRQPLIWTSSNPRAAERAATYVFLASIVGTLRPGRGRGASAPEVKAATSVPDSSYTITDADEVVEALVHPDRGLSAIEIIPGQGNNKPARYFLSTRLTHRMLVNNIRRTITETERDAIIAEAAERLSSTGPFRERKFVRAELDRSGTDVLSTAGIDTAHTTRLIVLDPAQFSLRNGMEEGTLEALTAAMGLGTGTGQMPVQWASSAVFAVVNTQRRALARTMAIELLARQKALEAPEVQNDAELKLTGTKDLAEAKANFEKHLKRAYQHVAYLAQPDPDGDRYLDQVTFDEEHKSALDGTIVWKALAERDKVFDSGQFTARGLVHNLRDNDYGRTLSDIRAAFYSAPRLPLLFGGDRDLQQAIYDAVSDGLVEIVNGTGEVVAVTGPTQVNLSSAGLRLAKPMPVDVEPTSAVDGSGGTQAGAFGASPASGGVGSGTSSGGTSTYGTGAGGGATAATAANEQQINFSLSQNLLGNQAIADDLASMFKALYTALDEGKVSYLQTTVQLVAGTDVVEALKAVLDQAGINTTTKDI